MMRPWNAAIVLTIILSACERTADSWQGYVEGDTLQIAAPVSGKLSSLLVEEGVRVSAEQQLFILDPEPEATALIAAQAQADIAVAELADLQKGSRPQELAVIEAQYAQAKAAAELSLQQLQRIRALVQRKLEGQEALDEITTQHERDLKRLDEIAAQLESARLAARTDRLVAAEAKVRAAQAEADQVRWRLNEKNQSAPQAGLVQDVLFRPGEYVAAGQPVLALLPSERIKIRFFIPEPQLAEVKENSTVTITCDGCASSFSATVRYISPRAEYTPPFIYSKENRQKFVYLAEAWPSIEDAQLLHPGQPVDVALAGN
jgi:HlyD family secretion protein